MKNVTIEVTNPYGEIATYEGSDWLKIGEDILAFESKKNPDSYSVIIKRFDRILHNGGWRQSVGLETIVTLSGSLLGYRIEMEEFTTNKNFLN